MSDRTVVLGITGSIAAYKAAELTRLFVRSGYRVHVVMTVSATRFIASLTLQTLSGNPVAVDMFAPPVRWDLAHIELAQAADVLVVAPASANAIAKFAHGLADDMLSTVALAAVGRGCPLVIAPAMNKSMLQHPATADNLDRLERMGAVIVSGEEGELACGERGSGRMAEPPVILARVEELVTNRSPWSGRDVLVTAGPTREHIDRVRFLSNPSSGKMGYELAAALRRLGAHVTLVTGPVSLPAPAGTDVVRVVSAADMCREVASRLADVDALFMAAAVADFAPAAMRDDKAPKAEILAGGALELTPTPDILAAAGQQRGTDKRPLLIGFAATVGPLVQGGDKVRAKGADLVVSNDVSGPDTGFEVDTNRAALYYADGRVEQLPLMNKRELAELIALRAADLL